MPPPGPSRNTFGTNPLYKAAALKPKEHHCAIPSAIFKKIKLESVID
jgi:hypothetical protein